MVEQDCPEVTPIRDRILSLRRRRNWSGQGAGAITAAACRAAVRFLDEMLAVDPFMPMPRVAPSAKGAVSLYWKSDFGHVLINFQSGDLGQIRFHWEGPAGQFEDSVVDSRKAIEMLREVV